MRTEKKKKKASPPRTGGTKGKAGVWVPETIAIAANAKTTAGLPWRARVMERGAVWAYSLRGDAVTVRTSCIRGVGQDSGFSFLRAFQCPSKSFSLANTHWEPIGQDAGEDWRASVRANSQLICTWGLWTRPALNFLSNLTNKTKLEQFYYLKTLLLASISQSLEKETREHPKSKSMNSTLLF